jgi:hypothetical protein
LFNTQIYNYITIYAKKDENITKIIDRLLYIFDSEGGNFNKLAISIGLSSSYFSKMAKNRGSLGEDVICKILLYYENINHEWLLTGKGQMKKNETVPDQPIFELLKKQLEEKDKQIAQKDKQITILAEALKKEKNDTAAPVEKRSRAVK